MPNIREKTWTASTPARTEDAQFWENHLIDDASYEGLQELLEGGGGSGGHIIENPSGVQMEQQPVLQFVNATVINQNGKTVVTGSGEKGDAATVSIGTVTTGPAGSQASVTNSGTQYDAVLDFTIPRGSNGSGVPPGGSAGQVLTKSSATSGDVSWQDVDGLPSGGAAGQVLTKQSSAAGDAAWSSIELDASDIAVGSGTVDDLVGSIATVETSPTTASHAAGELIVYNGQLYRVTAAITTGQTLTVGSNIASTNVSSVIDDLFEGTAHSLTGVDLNTFYVPGVYYVANSSNLPAGNNGTLIVMGTASNYVRQIFFRVGTINSTDGDIFTRLVNRSSGAIGTWYRIYNSKTNAYNVGDTYGITGWFTAAGHLTSSATTIQFWFPIPIPINATNFNLSSLRVTARKASGGYLLNDVTVTGDSTYTVTCAVINNGLRFSIAKSTAFDETNNTPVTVQLQSFSGTFS